jgi:putative transposase
VRTSLQHYQQLNLLGTLCLGPEDERIKLHVNSHRKNVTGNEVIAFVKHLRRYVAGPIILVWDNHPLHKRRMVQAFLADDLEIHLYWFPTCAPELNPVEFVWNQVSEYTAGTAPRNATELGAIVRAGVARTRKSSKRLWACVFASGLPWDREVNGK